MSRLRTPLMPVVPPGFKLAPQTRVSDRRLKFYRSLVLRTKLLAPYTMYEPLFITFTVFSRNRRVGQSVRWKRRSIPLPQRGPSLAG